MKPCIHRYRTVRVEKKVIVHPTMGACRREHRECKDCGDKRVDHLLVEADGSGLLDNVFGLEAVK